MNEEIVGTQTLVKARTDGMTLMGPLKEEVGKLVITDAASYQQADSILSRVMTARKIWVARIDPIIDPIYDALQLLYALKNDIKHPLDDYEKTIKGMMRTYKLEEAKQLRAAEDKRQADIAKAKAEAEEKERKAATARTTQMRNKLMEQSAMATQTAAIKEIQGPAQAVKAGSSVVKAKKLAKVDNLIELLKGIISGEIPDDIISVNQVELNAAYRLEPALVSAWPGVVIEDDITISGRRM